MISSIFKQIDIVFIFKSKKYFIWKINVKNDFRFNIVEWTIITSIKITFIFENLKIKNIEYDFIDANAKMKTFDFVIVIKKYNQNLNKIFFYLFNAINLNYRFFIFVISNSISQIYWTKITKRFKKNISIFFVDFIFKFIDRSITFANVEFYIKIVKFLHNQLQTKKIDSKFIVDVFCQNILLFKMHKIFQFNYFVTRQRDEWIFDNINFIEIETHFLNFVKIIVDIFISIQKFIVLTIDRFEKSKRVRFNASKIKYIDIFCTNQKCIDNKRIKHDFFKCYYNYSKNVFNKWIDIHMFDYFYDKTFKKTRKSQ